MRRNKAPPPQDKMSNNNNNLNQYSVDQVDDSTPNRIRPRTTDNMNNNTSNRSRYEIDHGSSDYNSHPLTSNSPLIIDDSQLRADSPGSHSSKDGLHHRKSHHHHINQHPIQHLSHPLAVSNNQQSSSLVHHNPNRNSQQQQRSRIKSNNHLPSHLVQRSRSSVGNNNSQKMIWKRVIQCIFIALIVMLAIVYVLLHNKVHNQQSINEHENEIDLPWQQQKISHTAKDVTKNNGEAVDITEGQSSRADERSPRKMFNNNNRQADKSPQEDKQTINHEVRIPQIVKQTREKREPAKPQDYIFKSIPLQQPTNYNPSSSTSNNNAQTIQQWSQESINKAQTDFAKKRKSRKLRTSRHVNKKLSSSIPKWYELHHDIEGTILNIQNRWSNDEGSGDKGGKSGSSDDHDSDEKIDISSLCGHNTQSAASQHPLNYLHSPSSNSSHQTLNSNSRILITGILSPLGIHLAIALYRQCSITNFIGLDTQFPNDPMNRLEQLERWSVLKQELENVDLIVPFLGLEMKSHREGGTYEEEKMYLEVNSGPLSGTNREYHEKTLVELREQATKKQSSTDSKSYTKPYRRYGIPLTPGTTKSGSGPLDIILSYRPTHIVHLAGTQSDSLLNSNYHQGGGGDESHESTIFQNKEEEEDDILIESISSRPHLFDLRMGMTGMEQLLSGVVAQTMISPSTNAYDHNNGDVYKDTEKKELAKRKRPHVVYASSYDALHFRDMAHHLNKKKTSKRGSSFDEESVLGHSISQSPQPKRPPRGLHGVSRLIDELIASSYHALHDIPSVGLRFDSIYGPRGFGVPSTSVPIFHSDRIKPGRTKRGVSPDVDLAETAVRNLYKGWSSEVKIKLDKEAEEEEGDDDEEEEEENRRRRLSEVKKSHRSDLVDRFNKLTSEQQQAHSHHVNPNPNLIEETGWMHVAHDPRDFVFVEDAVRAIITAMQYNPVDGSPTTFNIGSGEISNLASLADGIQELADVEFHRAPTKDVIDVEQSSAARAASLSSNDYLGWSATTSLKDGAAKLLAWHIDRALPFFPPSTDSEHVDYSSVQVLTKEQQADGELPMSIPIDGEKILNRRGLSSCSSDDPMCLRELHTSYPCSSECSSQSCTPSIFDGVMDITHEATEDCDIVMYTMALGYDIENMEIETEYSDGSEQEEWDETTVCTIAFIPSESTLAKNVISQIPISSLAKRDIPPNSDYDTKVKKLSGYIAHKGWALVLVDGATEPLTAEDMFMLKLSPARMFHETVRKLMFVDENFSHTPYPEDAQFLTSETSRGVLKKRTITGPDAKGNKVKYKLPEEPQRRAVLLVSPMRKIPDVDGDKMPLADVTISLMEDVGLDTNDIEPTEIRTQRQFYTQARSLINSNDLRSLTSVAQNKIEIKDFIRSKWIVHHLKLEEGHQLRCEWYREHVRWGTHLDQLSFAYVMAKRELTRKIITKQPVPPKRTDGLTILEQIIRIKSDAHEWYPIFSAEGAANAIHVSDISPEVVPPNLQDLPENEVHDAKPDAYYSDDSSTYYVRIMSDERMMESRKQWMKLKNNHRKYVTRMKEKQAQRAAEAEGGV